MSGGIRPYQDEIMILDRKLRSIVAVRSSVPENAFTARTLGTSREGSGVVIRDDGVVLTIGYLIIEAEEVWLTSREGRVISAHVIAYDQETGFGLVQAHGPLGASAVDFGNAGEAKVGAPVVLADGSGRSVQSTIVAKQEFAGYWEYLLDEAIFIAPAHPAWGGAGLFSANGNLLGLGSLLLQMGRDGESEDINMVVPIDLLPPILDDLLAHGEVAKEPRPWLGAFSAETNGEVIVLSVTDGGPAARAGLKRGDVISDIRDARVDGLADFYRKVWGSGPAGAEIPIRVVRKGRERWLRVKSADRRDFLWKPQLQ